MSNQPLVTPLTDGGELVKTAISTYQGQRLFNCRACGQPMPVKYLVQGKSPATNDSETIYWKFIEDEHGHTLKDDSY